MADMYHNPGFMLISTVVGVFCVLLFCLRSVSYAQRILIWELGLELSWLTPLSIIFQLYHGGRFSLFFFLLVEGTGENH